MDKAQLPLIAELSLGADTQDSNASTAPRKFNDTWNPRNIRALTALLQGPVPREQLDRIAGVSNGPDLIMEMRDAGLKIPCKRVPRIDRDGVKRYPGIYSLTEADRAVVMQTFASKGACHD
jgi:hypothetical protein